MSLEPAVAAVRLAVRRDLADVGDAPVLVACSGGADSLALLTATVFEGRTKGWHVVGVTVDHGLQDGSDEQAARVVGQMATLGADETVSVQVRVEARGQGPEAAAREARYAVLEEVAQRWEAAVVLLGHTRDDQAETVLLGLARGSGGRSLAGMRRRFDRFRRPLLDVSRAQTEAVCRAEGITFWSDPHNDDPAYARARVRHRVLPVLERELGPGVAEALARTADLLRDDTAALEGLAGDLTDRARCAGGLLDTAVLAGQPVALTTRVVRKAALEAGCPASELTRGHVLGVVALVPGKEVQLPGHVTAYVEGGLLTFRRTAVKG
jgi:tRNA(Ile)-lysidine synthase